MPRPSRSLFAKGRNHEHMRNGVLCGREKGFASAASYPPLQNARTGHPATTRLGRPKNKSPGLGGEHRDPGWLFRIGGEWRGRISGGPAWARGCRGAEPLTLTKDARLVAARVRVTEQRYRLRLTSSALTCSVPRECRRPPSSPGQGSRPYSRTHA